MSSKTILFLVILLIILLIVFILFLARSNRKKSSAGPDKINRREVLNSISFPQPIARLTSYRLYSDHFHPATLHLSRLKTRWRLPIIFHLSAICVKTAIMPAFSMEGILRSTIWSDSWIIREPIISWKHSDPSIKRSVWMKISVGAIRISIYLNGRSRLWTP